MLKDAIRKKQHSIKKKLVNSSQPTKLTTQIKHIIKFNKIFIPKIIFHLITRL